MNQDQNPYEFIMDPSQQKKSFGPNLLKNPNQKTIVTIIFVVVVIVFIFAGISLISSLNKQDNSKLASVAAYQTEIIRVADLGLIESTDPNTRAKVATLRAFLTTDLGGVNSYVEKAGIEFTTIQFATSDKAKIDATLESASVRNKYDQELLLTLDSLNQKYKTSLQQAINEDTESTTRIAVLATAAENILLYEGSETE